jgi:cell division protein ZapA
MSSEDKYNKRKYSVKILGEEQTVVGEVSHEYVNKLANYINEVGSEITDAYPRLPRRRLLGLTLINMADEFYKLKNDYLKKARELRKLKEENEELKKKIKEIKKENNEVMSLLEEVD